jgi:hypothetical protein
MTFWMPDRTQNFVTTKMKKMTMTHAARQNLTVLLINYSIRTTRDPVNGNATNC